MAERWERMARAIIPGSDVWQKQWAQKAHELNTKAREEADATLRELSPEYFHGCEIVDCFICEMESWQ